METIKYINDHDYDFVKFDSTKNISTNKHIGPRLSESHEVLNVKHFKSDENHVPQELLEISINNPLKEKRLKYIGKNLPKLKLSNHIPSFETNVSTGLKRIAKGSFGTIIQIKNTNFVFKRSFNRHEALQSLETEIKILDELKPYKHENIILMTGYVSFKGFLSFTMPLCDYALSDLLFTENINNQELLIGEIKNLLKQLVNAVGFLHEPKYDKNLKKNIKYIHRDLKSENILIKLNEKGVKILKVADFGNAVKIEEGGGAIGDVGTIRIMPPEMFGSMTLDKYDECVDWWSTGCVAIEMITKKRVWSDFIGEQETFIKFMMKTKSKPAYPENSEDDFVEFLSTCFENKTCNKQKLLSLKFFN